MVAMMKPPHLSDEELRKFAEGQCKWVAAHVPAKEAVRIYRELAAEQPDAFRPHLATSLRTLASQLGELELYTDALIPAKEAVQIFRELAAKQPDAFRPLLAAGLNSLGCRLSGMGRPADGILRADEAVRIYRELAAEQPDAFRPHLAKLLWILGEKVLRSDSWTQAGFDTVREGVQVLRERFLKEPQGVANLMVGLCRTYLAACQELHIQPDAELLAPISETLERIQLADKEAEPE